MKGRISMRVAIIGAGLTGLTAAYRLSLKGHKVVIFEKSLDLGGLAESFNVGSEKLDKFYHHMFTSDSELLDLINNLSLKEKLNWYEPKNAIYINNKLYPFTSPLDLLRFKPLRFISRIRMGLLVVKSKFIKDFRPFESITANEWIIKSSGQEVYDKIWGPLLKSKFDIDADKISGTWIWNKFKLRGSSRGKSVCKEKLCYIDGGFITIINTLASNIIKNGGIIKNNSQVIKISKTNNKLIQIETQQGCEIFDKVLFTAAPELLSSVCPTLPELYKNSLNEINYKANLCLTLEIEESLSPFYWITISQEGFPFVLIIEHTNLVGMKDYKSHIVYLSRYLDRSDPLFNASEKEISEAFISGLRKVFPNFPVNCIKKQTLTMARFSQPVVTIGYEKNIPTLQTPIQGLFLASMPQIYPEDRGLNYAVRLDNQVSNEILKS